MKKLLIILIGVLFFALINTQITAQTDTHEPGYAEVDTAVVSIGLNGTNEVAHAINVYGMDSKIKYQRVYYYNGEIENHTANLHIDDINLRKSYNTFLNMSHYLSQLSVEEECIFFNDFLRMDGQKAINIKEFKEIVKGITVKQFIETPIDNSQLRISAVKESVAFLCGFFLVFAGFAIIIGGSIRRKKKRSSGDTS